MHIYQNYGIRPLGQPCKGANIIKERCLCVGLPIQLTHRSSEQVRLGGMPGYAAMLDLPLDDFLDAAYAPTAANPAEEWLAMVLEDPGGELWLQHLAYDHIA